MFSTLVDIAAWSAWLSSGFDPHNGDDAVLSRASRRLMQRVYTPIHSMATRMVRPDGDNIGYGLGLIVEQDTRFGDFAQHSGGLPGFSTNMRWHLSTGIGITIFTNTNGLSPVLWAEEMLRAVLDDLDAPAKIVMLWPETLHAAKAIEAAVLGSGHLADAGDLFSDNVLSDIPAELRDTRLAETVNAVGGLVAAADLPPLSTRMMWSNSAADLCWSIPGRDAELMCRIELTETIPSQIQRIDIEVRPGQSESDLVNQHYRPAVP
jgi:hypothetical protein